MRIIEYSLQADQDLEGIFEFSYFRFGKSQTEKYLKSLEAHIFMLAKSHIIFYHFNDSKLRVERVLHGKSDYLNLKIF